LIDFAVNFLLLSVPVQVIAWRIVSEMTCNVSIGTLNLTHSLTTNHDQCRLNRKVVHVHTLSCIVCYSENISANSYPLFY